MKLKNLFEAEHFFDDFENLKFDPDRADVHDIASNLLPLLVKMSYVNLTYKKNEHEKRWGPKSEDEDAYNFDDFTTNGLVDEVDNTISILVDKLKDVSTSDVKSIIKDIKFKYELEK